jgi:hypothetical protein
MRLRPHFWHEPAIILGGPLAMALASYSLAVVIEKGAGPVIPPVSEPGEGKPEWKVRETAWAEAPDGRPAGGTSGVNHSETAEIVMLFG